MLQLLCPRDAGKILGLTSQSVQYHAIQGHLPEIRDSAGRRLFLRADVMKFKIERERKARRVAKEAAVSK